MVEYGLPRIPGSALKSPRIMTFEVEGRVPIAASIWSRDSLKTSVQSERDGKYTEKLKRGDGEVFSSIPITWWVDIIGVGLIRWSSLVCHPRATPPWPLSRCGVQKMGCSLRGGETVLNV